MARTKGSLNRKTRIALEGVKNGDLDASGVSSPVRYMLRIMNDSRKAEPLRLEAAKAAAPYLQPKLSSVDLNANSPQLLPSEEELVGKLVELIQKYPELGQKLLQGKLGTVVAGTGTVN
jgi:hypothetical protein